MTRGLSHVIDSTHLGAKVSKSEERMWPMSILNVELPSKELECPRMGNGLAPKGIERRDQFSVGLESVRSVRIMQ